MNGFLNLMIAAAKKRGLWQKLAPRERRCFVVYLHEQYKCKSAGDIKGTPLLTGESKNGNFDPIKAAD